MLALLAAVIPATAGIIVAVALLVDHSKKTRDLLNYRAIKTWFEAASSENQPGNDPEAFNQRSAELRAERDRRYRAARLEANLGTRSRLNEAAGPTPPRAADVWQQWTLIVGAVVGIILAAVDLALSTCQ